MYPTGARRFAGGGERCRLFVLTTRDWDIVGWVGRVGAAGADDVRVAFGLGRTVAYRRLAACADAGTLETVRLLYGTPALYVATATGLRHSDLAEVSPTRIGAGTFTHFRACARLAAAVQAGGVYDVCGESYLRVAERRVGHLIASTHTGPDEGRLHRPDLVLQPSDGGPVIAVEVELSVKTPARLAMICRAWGRCRHVGAVRYYAAPAALRALQRAVTDTRTEHHIQLRPLPWDPRS